MRVSEALALRWDDVNLIDAVLHVRHSWSRDGSLTRRKPRPALTTSHSRRGSSICLAPLSCGKDQLRDSRPPPPPLKPGTPRGWDSGSIDKGTYALAEAATAPAEERRARRRSRSDEDHTRESGLIGSPYLRVLE